LLNLKLTLIGNDRETLDSVQEYFLRAGAGVRTTSRLEDVHPAVAGVDAVILFADHYARDDALRIVVELSVRTIIVVTADVAFFSASRTARSVAGRVFVLRRPVWGWMLIDAVRSGMGGNVGQS